MLIDLLSNTGYIIVNKEIIKKIGLHEAILLGELCSEYIYWKKKDETVNEFFYSTRENIEENTGLSAYQQRTAISNLVKKDIIVMKSEGMPLKTWYFINENKLQELLFDNIEEDTENEMEKSSSKDVIQQDVKKIDNKALNNFRTSYEEILQHDVKEANINNNKNNNNILSNLITEETEQKDEMRYDEIFKQNIEYDILVQDIKNKELIKNITDIAVETLNTSKKEIYINSEPKAIEVVRSQLLKLNPMHIQYIINCLQQNTKDVKSIKSYILTSLYNAVNTMEIDTTLQVAKIMNN